MEIFNSFQTSVRRALDEIDINWPRYRGLIICGTHSPEEVDVEMLISKIKLARELEIPFLGICFGHQLAAIEYARNVLGIKDAVSEEWGVGTFIVKKMPQLNVGLKDGESYWNNYEVNLPNWEKPKNFFTSQFHPEYESSIDKPHPLLIKFLKYAKDLS